MPPDVSDSLNSSWSTCPYSPYQIVSVCFHIWISFKLHVIQRKHVLVCVASCMCLHSWGVLVRPSVCTHDLDSLLCSSEISRSWDSSSRMSWLDSGRPWELLLCEHAASDNLSSSLCDDSLLVMQPRSHPALKHDVERQRSGLIKTALCCRDVSLQKPFLYLFFLHSFYSSRGWGLLNTAGIARAKESPLHWECRL